MMKKMDSETPEQNRLEALAKLDLVSKEEMLEDSLVSKWRDIFTLTKIIMSLAGKEKAKELLEKAKYDAAYKVGREYAEKRGFPKDLKSFEEAKTDFFSKKIRTAAFKCGPVENESTENRQVRRCTKCYLADAILKVGAEDPETLEVARYFAANDEGWANGFNPDMKFERTKWLLDGDPYCEFIIEVE